VSIVNNSGITNLLESLLSSFETILTSKSKMAAVRHLDKQSVTSPASDEPERQMGCHFPLIMA